jgi:formiminotetrahydrofolate cyclodeaminase
MEVMARCHDKDGGIEMPNQSNSEHYARRAMMERARSALSTDYRIAAIHAELAARCEEMALVSNAQNQQRDRPR